MSPAGAFQSNWLEHFSLAAAERRVGEVAAAHPDFFISRTGADKGAAELIAGIIREAGLAPFYQDEDFGHADFMRMIEVGFEGAAKLIVLLSELYQKSEYTRKEYNTFLLGDPGNLKKRVFVFRVGDSVPSGNLATLAYTDLVPVLNDYTSLRQAVREALGIDKRTPGSIGNILARAGQQIRHPNIRAVKGFTGRDDMLDALAKKLAAKSAVAIRNSSQTTLAMRGMGGVGKTVLAQEFAWRNREDYYGIWWLRADKAEILVDDLVELGARFIPGLGDLKPEDAALKTVDQLAQMRTEKPWLLLYDNAEGPALLRRFTPAENAHVLITTRRTDLHGEADEELAVDVFDRDTAIAYLLKQARNGDADLAGRLADALHCLPLALSHARAYCWARNWSFDRYVAKLSDLIAEAPKHAAYPASVFATFSLAIEKAAAECAEAETLMALFAFFAPDKIPLWLIPEEVLSEKQRDDALAALTSVSLAAHDSLPDGTPAASVHRLVQEVMRGRLRESGRFEETAAVAIELLYDAYDFYSDTVEIMHRRAAWLPQALAALDYAPREGDEAHQTVWVCNYIGHFRVSRGELGPARTTYEQGASIAESDPGNAGWQRDLSVSYNKVGDVLVEQGNLPEALNAYRDSLAIRERLAKSDPGNAGWQRDLYAALWFVADAEIRSGEQADALEKLLRAKEIMEGLAKADPGNAGWQRDLSIA
jgi:hypothetical protein